MAKNGHLLLSTRHTCAAASDVLLTPRPPVMTDRRTAAADCVTASHRRHFHDVLYSFFDAVDNFNLQCKHQQIIKMSSNEPTCFYINKDYVTYLNTNIMLSTIYQLTSAIPAHKFVKYRYIKYVATVTFNGLLPLQYGQVSRRRAADKICNIQFQQRTTNNAE